METIETGTVFASKLSGDAGEKMVAFQVVCFGVTRGTHVAVIVWLEAQSHLLRRE
jgi:hypothetical protein